MSSEQEMLERFTDRARRVVVLAREEARILNHNDIGAEHLLLGLIREGEGVAARALESLEISLEAVRQQVEKIIGRGRRAPSGHIGFAPRAKKVLELSLRESLALGQVHIGTEDILLGLIREGEGVAAQVLVRLGADLTRARQQVLRLVYGHQGKEPAGAPATPPEHGKPPAAARYLDQLPPGTAQVTLVGVRVDSEADQPVVLLKEVRGDRYLPIWIGQVEAAAIVRAQKGMKGAQPLTHDLFCDVLKTMGVQLLNVTISALRAGSTLEPDIFESYLSLADRGTVSSRPSDAIALAVRTGAPILVSVEILDKAGISLPGDVS
jgi:bifunctional DNase/RNase